MGKAILEILQKLYGSGFLQRIMGTRTNVVKPKEFDINAPTKNVYSNDAFKDEKLIEKVDEQIMEYAPYILSNRNAREQANFLENAKQLLKARKKQTGSDFPDPKTEVVEEADIVDIKTGKTMDEEGIMSLKEDLGIPEGIDPRSTMGKAITEAGTIKRETKKMSDEMDDTLAKAVDAFFGRTKASKDIFMEGKRRAAMRQILLNDDRLNLPKDVEESLRGYKDLQGFSGVPEMDPLTLFDKFYKRDIDKLDALDDIIDIADNERDAAKKFLQRERFDLVEDTKPPKPPRDEKAGGGLSYLMGM